MSERSDKREVLVLTKWKLYIALGALLVSAVSQAAVAWYRVSNHEERIQKLEDSESSRITLSADIKNLSEQIKRFESKLDKNDDEILKLWKERK